MKVIYRNQKIYHTSESNNDNGVLIILLIILITRMQQNDNFTQPKLLEHT